MVRIEHCIRHYSALIREKDKVGLHPKIAPTVNEYY
jgi:hypothetical protein